MLVAVELEREGDLVCLIRPGVLGYVDVKPLATGDPVDVAIGVLHGRLNREQSRRFQRLFGDVLREIGEREVREADAEAKRLLDVVMPRVIGGES